MNRTIYMPERDFERALGALLKVDAAAGRLSRDPWEAIAPRLGGQRSRRPWEYVMDAINKPRMPFNTRYIYAAGGALVVVIAALLLLLLLNTDDGTSGESVPAAPSEGIAPDGGAGQIIPREVVLSISDLENVGITTLRQYEVIDLPGATDAWFGFRRVGGTSPADFELRFYTDHDSAVANGVRFADDATGEDANLVSTSAAWVTGIQDRVVLNPRFGQSRPKYMDYVVYGNIVALCEGRTVLDSQAACNWLIEQLDQ